MIKTNITADRLRELVHYNPETGVFTRTERVWKVGFVGDIIGYKNPTGRIEVSINGKIYLAHRVAWMYMTGSWPRGVIDHINGDPSDNRFINLRDVSQSENMQNQRNPKSNNTSGYLGVRKKRNRWAASIVTRGQFTHLGVFDTPELAHAAYLAAKRAMHSTCTI